MMVETDEFLADVKDGLSEDERDALILYVAQQPEAGVPMPGVQADLNDKAAVGPRRATARAEGRLEEEEEEMKQGEWQAGPGASYACAGAQVDVRTFGPRWD
jgi:hypothetical protein